jgi:hypothetical protein
MPRSGGRNRSEFPNQPLPVHCAQLVQCSLAGFSLKAHRHASGVRTHGSGHRSNNDGLQISVHLIGRNHQAWPGLLYFSALGGIERQQPNFVPAWSAAHHRHSLRSNSFVPVVPSRCSSSRAGPAARNFSSHPSRGRRSGEMIRHSFSSRRSTASPRPHCSMRGFGMRIPREFPMRTSSIFIIGKRTT